MVTIGQQGQLFPLWLLFFQGKLEENLTEFHSIVGTIGSEYFRNI